MSNSTDEDAERVIRFRNIGVLESEVESVTKGVSSGGVSSGAESSDVDRDLVIAEEENQKVSQVAESVVPSGRAPRGFGEIDSDDSSDEDASKPIEAEDVLLIHSTDSEARHGLGYLHDQKG